MLGRTRIPGSLSRVGRVVVGGIAAVLLSGCIGSIDRTEFAAEYEARGGGLSGDRLVDVARDIEARVAPAELIIRSASVSHLSVTLTVSTGARPEETDSWTWGPGGLRGPTPSRNLDADEQRLGFSVDDLDADVIEQAVDAAVAQSALREPFASTVSFTGREGGGFDGSINVTNRRDNEIWSFDSSGVPTRSGS